MQPHYCHPSASAFPMCSLQEERCACCHFPSLRRLFSKQLHRRESFTAYHFVPSITSSRSSRVLWKCHHECNAHPHAPSPVRSGPPKPRTPSWTSSIFPFLQRGMAYPDHAPLMGPRSPPRNLNGECNAMPQAYLQLSELGRQAAAVARACRVPRDLPDNASRGASITNAVL